MLDYHGGFRLYGGSKHEISKMFFAQHDQSEYTVLQDTLGLQAAIVLKLKPFMREHVYDNKGMCYNMCVHNSLSLYAANDILKSDSFHVFYAILRVVFESFPKLFYCLTNKEGAKHVFCCEEFFYLKKAAQRTDKGIESYCKSVKDVNGEKCKYVKDPKWFRKEVYTDNRQHELDRRYALYSTASHPSIDTINAMNWDEVKYGWTMGLSIITSYSLMNLFIMVNVVAEELKMCFEFDGSKWFVKDRMEKVWNNVGDSIRSLYPDKDEYVKELSFVLPI